MLTAAGSPISASMLKDIERGGAVEADHVLGDLIARDPGPPRASRCCASPTPTSRPTRPGARSRPDAGVPQATSDTVVA